MILHQLLPIHHLQTLVGIFHKARILCTATRIQLLHINPTNIVYEHLPDRQPDESKQEMVIGSVVQQHKAELLGQHFVLHSVLINTFNCVQVDVVERGKHALFLVQVEEVLFDSIHISQLQRVGHIEQSC